MTIPSVLSMILAFMFPYAAQVGIPIPGPGRSAAGSAGITQVSFTSQSNAGGSNTVTTSAISTVGATLLVAAISAQGAGTLTPCDSTSGAPTANCGASTNTCQCLTATTGWFIRLCYVYNPTVGASHQFMAHGNGLAPSIWVASFSGTLTTSGVIDTSSQFGTGSNSTTCQPGSITPSAADELIISAWTYYNYTAAASTINLSFTAEGFKAGTGSIPAINGAYLVYPSTSAINPTWSTSQSNGGTACAIAAFKHP
jgi:hypothetical protein